MGDCKVQQHRARLDTKEAGIASKGQESGTTTSLVKKRQDKVQALSNTRSIHTPCIDSTKGTETKKQNRTTQDGGGMRRDDSLSLSGDGALLR